METTLTRHEWAILFDAIHSSGKRAIERLEESIEFFKDIGGGKLAIRSREHVIAYLRKTKRHHYGVWDHKRNPRGISPASVRLGQHDSAPQAARVVRRKLALRTVPDDVRATPEAVLVALTGKPADTATALRQATRRKKCSLVISPAHFEEAAHRLGIKTERIYTGPRVARETYMRGLRGWVRERKPGVYVVLASRHYAVLHVGESGNKWCDVHNRKPVAERSLRTPALFGWRSKLVAAWKIK